MDFGPCPKCLKWMLKSNIPYHQSKCKGNVDNESDVSSGKDAPETITEKIATSDIEVETPDDDISVPVASKRKKTDKKSANMLKYESDVLAGRIPRDVEGEVQKVVVGMKKDDIAMIAINDPLILAIGESWYRRNIGSPKGRHHASSHMGLLAKLLLAIHDKTKNKFKMLDYINPVYFDVVQACLSG